MEYRDALVWRDEVALAVRDYGGGGHPILLLHGGTRNLCDWGALIPRLVAQHRVVALDFRSHGASTPCEGVWTFADAVADVEAIVANLALDNPFLIGHSLGGMVATLYGAYHPECPGVVNVDGIGVSLPTVFPGPDPDRARQQVRDIIELMVSAMEVRNAATALLDGATVAQRLAAQRTQSEQRGQDWSLLGSFVERSFFRHPDGRYQENPSPVAQAAFSTALLDFDIFSVTRSVACPLLFIGAMGRAASSAGGDELSEAITLWRRGVQLEFAQIARECSNVQWRGLAGEHMLVLDEVAPLADELLRFMGALA